MQMTYSSMISLSMTGMFSEDNYKGVAPLLFKLPQVFKSEPSNNLVLVHLQMSLNMLRSWQYLNVRVID